MNTYRSKETIQAEQYTGAPIPGVTCQGTPEERQVHGCDGTRAHLPHVHTQSTGGLDVLQPGTWIFPVRGGPFGVASDARFRANWEVDPGEPLLTPHIPTLNEELAAAGLPTEAEIRGALVTAHKPLDVILAENGLPSAGQIRQTMATPPTAPPAAPVPAPPQVVPPVPVAETAEPQPLPFETPRA